MLQILSEDIKVFDIMVYNKGEWNTIQSFVADLDDAGAYFYKYYRHGKYIMGIRP